jgi:periplasmic divalent cation tolerance protein
VTDLVIVLTTVPDARADELASRLVEERLAACVNVHGPMQSTYRWKGRIECEPERQLFIKTSGARLEALEMRLKELHPYELPELIVIRPETAGADYADWVRTETGGASGAR